MQYLLLNQESFTDGIFSTIIPPNSNRIELYSTTGTCLTDNSMAKIIDYGYEKVLNIYEENFNQSYFPIRVVFFDGSDVLSNLNLFNTIKTSDPDSDIRVAIGRKNKESKNVTYSDILNYSTISLPYLHKNPIYWQFNSSIVRDKFGVPSNEYTLNEYNKYLHLSNKIVKTIPQRRVTDSEQNIAITFDATLVKYNDDSVFVNVNWSNVATKHDVNKAIKLFDISSLGLIGPFSTPVIIFDGIHNEEKVYSQGENVVQLPFFLVITPMEKSLSFGGVNMDNNSVYIYIPYNGRSYNISGGYGVFTGSYYALSDIQF